MNNNIGISTPAGYYTSVTSDSTSCCGYSVLSTQTPKPNYCENEALKKTILNIILSIAPTEITSFSKLIWKITKTEFLVVAQSDRLLYASIEKEEKITNSFTFELSKKEAAQVNLKFIEWVDSEESRIVDELSDYFKAHDSADPMDKLIDNDSNE